MKYNNHFKIKGKHRLKYEQAKSQSIQVQQMLAITDYTAISNLLTKKVCH
jgi:hypothetical protein